MTGPFIDLTQFPYNVTQPWQGVDASVPDYTAAIQQAFDDARNQGWGLMDTGGTDGGRIIHPPFVSSISDKLVMHDGVALEGHTRASSRIMMRQNFPGTTPGKHMIDLGDATTGHASFGGQIKNMNISARKGVLAASGNFVVYSNNVQDSGAIIENCRIDGGSHFGGHKYMEGRGGTSLLKYADIEMIARKDALALGNVCMVVKVSGSTLVEIDGFEPSCDWVDNNNLSLGAVTGSLGLVALGGNFHIKRTHGEAVQIPIYFGYYGGHGQPGDPDYSPASDGNGYAHVEYVTGGGGNTKLIWVDHAQWTGKVTREHVMLKSPSIPHSFYSSINSALNSTVDIIDRSRV